MKAELESRPALVACSGLIFGILVPTVWWLCCGCILLLLWFCSKRNSRILLFAAFVVGLIIVPKNRLIVEQDRLPFSGRLQVVSVPQRYDGGFAADVADDAGLYRMTWETPSLSLGDAIKVQGEAIPIDASIRNATSFSGYLGRIRAASAGIERLSSGPEIFAMGIRWRDGFYKFSSVSLPPDQARILPALSFNIDSLLSSELRQNLQKTGTIHIISASGAHVLILAVSLLILLSTLPIPRHIQIFILFTVLTVYAAGAGFRPPIVRAVIMATMGLLAYAFRREPDWLSALGISVLGYLLWNPLSVFDIGFQLSFTTVGALALFIPRLEPVEGGVLRTIFARNKQLVFASFIASASSAPLVAYHFGQVSLISIPANVVIAPIVAPALVSSMLSYPISFAVPSLSQGIMSEIVAPLLALFESCVNAMGRLSFSSISVPEFSPYWIPTIYILLLMLWRPRARAE
jgi:competence protein ComEC